MDNSATKIINTPLGRASYEIVGSGRDSLVIHGSGGGSDQGRLIAQRLLPATRALCPARFGYQASALPEKMNTGLQAEAYADMLAEEGIKKVDVVAFSAGGPSAIEFASRYPDRCRSLILISAVGTPSLEKGLKARLAFSQLKDPDIMYGFLALVARKNKRLSFLGASKEIRRRLEKEDEHFLDLALKSLKNPSLRLKGTLADRDILPIPESTYRNISCPTLIIHAQDDKLVPLANAEHALGLIPNSTSYILPEGGHLLFTQHSKIQDMVYEFWNRISQQA